MEFFVSNLEEVTYNTIKIDKINTFEIDEYTLGKDGYKYDIYIKINKLVHNEGLHQYLF